MHRKPENIEVAVRARPLNNFENVQNEESAWDVKRGGLGSHRYGRRQLSRSNDRGMLETIHDEGCDKVIQLKNKYRFGFESKRRGTTRKIARNGSMSVRAMNQPRCKSAAVLAGRGATGIGRGVKALQASQSKMSALGMRNQSQTNQFQSSSALQPSHGFRTPYYTPTPRREEGTPHQQEVTEFSLYPQGAQGGGASARTQTQRQGNFASRGAAARDSSHRTKSLTATNYKKTNSKIPRLTSLTARKPDRSSKSALGFMTTSKNLFHKNERATAVATKQTAQHRFSYDHVYGERDTNRDVYEQTVRKVALASLEGINGTVFVYGQTGTGKTYTMMGQQRSKYNDGAFHGAKVRQPSMEANGRMESARTKSVYDKFENSGVLIFAVQDLFKRMSEMEIAQRGMNNIAQFQVKLSYIEIYNEMIHDLLASDRQSISEHVLSIHEGKDKEFFVKGANEVEVRSIQEVLDLISVGERNRHYAETYLNHSSSRSHTLFRLHITSFSGTQNAKNNRCLKISSYLNFVDLAGSEKISNYLGAAGGQGAEFSHNTRLKEGLSINKSLFYLTQVIHMLSQKTSKHIPYRNSTLTKILRSSLAGNSRTSVIICITPASSQIEQTISSLKFGQKAMKVQQSAKVQIDEIKSNAIKNRHNLNYNGCNGVEQRVFKEIVEEYEARIKGLEAQLSDNRQVQLLRDKVASLENERDRLVLALEHQGDRTFFTKQLFMNQQRGYQTMNLRIAGDIAIQTKPMAELSLEQLMEERQQANYESQVITKNCQLTANQLSQENKALKADNKDLKEECDRLENSYFEIIAEFSKMSNIQNEILEISNRNNRESLELTNLDKMTDREVQKLDQQFKQKLFQLKEEKEKRQRQRKMNDSMGRNSSGKRQSFVRPYSTYNNNMHLSLTSLTQRSHKSTPRKSQRHNNSQNMHGIQHLINSGREAKMTCESAISDDVHIKNLNGTFGQKKNKRITETIGGIVIDKSLYAQDNSKKNIATLSTERASRERKDLPREPRDHQNESASAQEQPEILSVHPETLPQTQRNSDIDQPIPFNQMNNFNQFLHQLQANPQFHVIKEEDENNVTSFDNLSNSLGFDISTPAMPVGSASMSAHSGCHQVNESQISNAQRRNINANESAQKVFLNAETPKRQILAVEPHAIGYNPFKDLDMGNPLNCNTFDNSLEKLSEVGLKADHQILSYDKRGGRSKQGSVADQMNEELMMEFQLEQLLAQQINLNENYSLQLGTRKHEPEENLYFIKTKSAKKQQPVYEPYSSNTNEDTSQEPNKHFSFKNTAQKDSPEPITDSKKKVGILNLIQNMSGSELKNTNGQSMSQPQNTKKEKRDTSRDYVSFQHSGVNSKFESQKASLVQQPVTSEKKQKTKSRQRQGSKTKMTKILKEQKVKSPKKSQPRSPAPGAKSKSKSRLSRQSSGLLSKVATPCLTTSRKPFSTAATPRQVTSTRQKPSTKAASSIHSQASATHFIDQPRQVDSRNSCSVNQTSTSNTNRNHQQMSTQQSGSSKLDQVSVCTDSVHKRAQSGQVQSNSKQSVDGIPMINTQNQSYNTIREHKTRGGGNSRTKNMCIDLRSEARSGCLDEEQSNVEYSDINIGLFGEDIKFSIDQEKGFQTPKEMCYDLPRQQESEKEDGPDSNCMKPEESQPKVIEINNGEESSEIPTPYGLIEINDEDFSDNAFSHKECHQVQLDNLAHDHSRNLYYKASTPINSEQQSQNKFFGDGRRANSNAFNGALQECSRLQLNRALEDDIQMEDSTSQNGSHVRGTSSISLSRSQTQSQNQSQSQSQSQTKSFKANLTKEMKTLERTNKKLKQHQDEYRKYYQEILAGGQLPEGCGDVELSPMQRYEQPQACVEQEIQQESEYISNELYDHCKKLSESRTESLVSNSTSQGLTQANTIRQSQSFNKHKHNFAADFNSNANRLSSDFEYISQNLCDNPQIRTSKDSTPSDRASDQNHDGATSQRSGIPAYVALNNRISQMSSQIEPNWQKKSQASLEKLQAEYEKIKQQRTRIMKNLDVQPNQPDSRQASRSRSPIHSQKSPMNTLKSPMSAVSSLKRESIVLQETKKHLKVKQFQPVQKASRKKRDTSQTKEPAQRLKKENRKLVEKRTPILTRNGSKNSIMPEWN